MEWLVKTQERLQRRVNEGPFTMKWIDLYLEEALRKGIKKLVLSIIYIVFMKRKNTMKHMLILVIRGLDVYKRNG